MLRGVGTESNNPEFRLLSSLLLSRRQRYSFETTSVAANSDVANRVNVTVPAFAG